MESSSATTANVRKAKSTADIKATMLMPTALVRSIIFKTLIYLEIFTISGQSGISLITIFQAKLIATAAWKVSKEIFHKKVDNFLQENIAIVTTVDADTDMACRKFTEDNVSFEQDTI